MTNKQFDSNSEKVKSYFETPETYLGRRDFDIRIRAETVKDFIQGQTFESVLDIGCGNGSISLPLLPLCKCQQLTLLDSSSRMLDLAREKITQDFRDKVIFINENLMTTELNPQSYDLIICLGVLAHVDSPDQVIAKIGKLLKPGGSLILEVCDGYHPVGQVLTFYHHLLNYLRSNIHKLNRLRTSDIVRVCSSYKLIPMAQYRYSLPPPGSHRLVSQQNLYIITRAIFGFTGNNRNKWLGHVTLYRFDKNSAPDS